MGCVKQQGLVFYVIGAYAGIGAVLLATPVAASKNMTRIAERAKKSPTASVHQ